MSELGGMWRIVFINRSAVQINAVKPNSTVSTRSFATEGNTLYHQNEGTHAARWKEVLRSRRILSRATYSPFFTHPTPFITVHSDANSDVASLSFFHMSRPSRSSVAPLLCAS